jgi:hypothetical protein
VGGTAAPVRLLPWLRYALLLLLMAVGAGALWLWLDGRFYVSAASVDGSVRVSPDEVVQVSGLVGLHIMWVRPTEVEARIVAALPSLESAKVVCGLPATCAVSVVERQPRILWDDDGESWWLDADGVLFPAEGVLAEGWVVRGPLPRGEDGRMDERVRVGLTELWATGVDVSPELYYVTDRGLLLTDRRGWRVFVGQGPGMAERLRALEWLAADLEARGVTPRFVDVRFADAPYYSLVNDW